MEFGSECQFRFTAQNLDLRYRARCFPGAAKEVFSPVDGGYAPLPYVARELLRHLKGAELKVWIYMLTRGGPQSIFYPTYEDILRGTGLETKGTVSKAINHEKIGLVRHATNAAHRRSLDSLTSSAVATFLD